MAWSTRELADLTGVTLRSIRHWHDIGLLPEPGRRSNGYKEYTAHHLALALRINRLAGLGFPLSTVASMLDSEEEGRASLQGLRDEVDGRIADLVRLRGEIDELIRRGVSPDLSPEALGAFEAMGGDPSSRNIAIVLSHMMPREDIRLLIDALQDGPEELHVANAAIGNLPGDATEPEIAAAADRATAPIQAFLATHQQVLTDVLDSPNAPLSLDVQTALATLVKDGMNPAQRRLLQLIEKNLAGSLG